MSNTTHKFVADPFGGVDLTVKPKYVSDDGTVYSIQKAVTSKLNEKVIEPTFNIKANGKLYKAAILPVTRKGQEIWKKTPSTTINGTKYQLNNRGEVAKSIDSNGNISEYVWDGNHRLKEFKITANNGLTILGNKKNGYSEITATNPRQNRFLSRYNSSGYLNEVIVNGKRYAIINYDGGSTSINYGNYMERIRYDSSGRLKRYEIYSSRDGAPSAKPQAVDINYDKNDYAAEVYFPNNEHVRLTYLHGNIKTVSTSRGKVDYLYEAHTGRIEQINTSWGESTRYDYEGQNLARIAYKNDDYHEDVILKDNLPVEVKNNNGGLTRYKYNSNGFLEQVTDPMDATASYSYDEQNMVKTINLPDGSSYNFQYEWHGSKETNESAMKMVRVTHTVSNVSSSPIAESMSSKQIKVKDISQTLTSRLKDIKEASRNLKNGIIIDIVTAENDAVHVNFTDADGNVQGINPDAAKELRRLLTTTASTHGKLGSSLLNRWQKFYDTNLLSIIKPTSWTCPDGRTVKIKPVLIIKSNEVSYKYANLEKVPTLADNFVIFIASKIKESKDVSETSAKDLVSKINDVPMLSRDNVVFAIRLPEMRKEERARWENEITKLERVVGKENVLFNPSKKDFNRMLQNRGKEIIVIELTHTDRGITLRENERYTSRDLLQCGDLSHIKYLIAGPGTCSLPRLEKGDFAAILREKGVGIMNTSYGEVSTKIALKRLKELIRILENVEEYNLPTYYLPDMIDQLMQISGEGTTNLGKLDCHEKDVLG